MAVWLPEIVKVLEPFAPELIVAPPAKVTVNVPCETVNWVEAKLPSTSLTLIVLAPVKLKATSSFTVCAAGTVFTGASLRPLISIVRVLDVSVT